MEMENTLIWYFLGYSQTIMNVWICVQIFNKNFVRNPMIVGFLFHCIVTIEGVIEMLDILIDILIDILLIIVCVLVIIVMSILLLAVIVGIVEAMQSGMPISLQEDVNGYCRVR